MTHAALSPLIGPEFDPFLGAAIGEDRNGTRLSVLSALARLDLDPWREARALARMPREAAAARLTALIDALPRGQPSGVPSRPSAADLVALLPKARIPSPQASDTELAAAAFRKTPILIGLGALVLMALVAFAVSTLFFVGVRSWRRPVGAARGRQHNGGAARAWPLKRDRSSALFRRPRRTMRRRQP